MNKVEISAEETPLPSWRGSARKYCLEVLERLNLSNWELSILFCNNQFIQQLNYKYKGIDAPTDVLSFCFNEETSFPTAEAGAKAVIAGDLVISLEMVKDNAQEYGVNEDEEIRRLLIHGILHLAGENHLTNTETEPMLKYQEDLLKELSPWKTTV
ncbi:MAG: rRNA maturation RNase YbeY [Spirochaetaceae bacterium]|jgi:probable rRNA maturation factor|nr:rRNA maturation RNase YbeY [Spirochaetaceae bacterium]